MPRPPAASARRVSVRLKLTLVLILQTAVTLAAVAVYYAYLSQEIRTYHGLFALLTEDARLLHRRLDNPAPLGVAGRESFRNFAGRFDKAIAALIGGGEYQGFRCQPIPGELTILRDDIEARWKLTRTALAAAAGSSEENEAAARRKLHNQFPHWQAALGRMQKALVLREGTIRSHMESTFLLIGGVNLAAFGVVLWLVRRFVTRPVQALQAAATRVAAGDYSTRAPVYGNDEISSLAEEFNRMSAQLHATVRALQSSEQDLAQKADALERSSRELEQYGYAAAHDLQEPLRILSLYTQLLNRRYELPPGAIQFTTQIQASAERMQRLVGDLLIHSRSVHEPARSAPTDPNLAVAEVLAYLRDEIAKSDAVVQSDPLPSVIAYAADLEIVFRNLIANALKYRGHHRPYVTIGAEIDNDLCTISVRDNGIGIDPEYHGRVFGLFKRLHGSEIPGTGVGLAVTKNLIEKHGGKIWVESESGRGATFNFQLRLALSAAV
jgi:signal transduction histidine kinase